MAFSKTKEFIKEYKYQSILALILIIAFVFRLKGLTLQGLWYDELYSVVLSSKHSLWKIIAECGQDVHPPFFQICLYYWFKIFPATEFLSRVYPLTLGMAGLCFMYLLGKELYDKMSGTFAISFGAVNFFLVYYSQEVRSYSQNFALTVLSTLLLVKLLKSPTVLKSISYGLITLMLMYSHYFGIVIGACQAIFVLFYLIIFKVKSFKEFLTLSISGFIVVFGYLPWIPTMFSQMETKDFWIKPIKNWFFIDYIINYFVNTPIAIAFVILFLFSIFYLFKKSDKHVEEKMEKWNVRISTVLIFSFVLLSYLIPYLKSLNSSVLTPRNTIVTLPFILIGAAAGLNIIAFKKIKIGVALLLVFFCGITTLNDSKGYLTKEKEKWREAVKAVIDHANMDNTIALSEANYKQYSYFQYYFNHFGSNIKVLHPSKYQFLSILNNSPENLEIWTLEGHWKPEVSKENLKILKAYYKVVEKYEFDTVKARKYVLKDKKSMKFIKEMFNKEGCFTAKGAKNPEAGKEEKSFTQRSLRCGDTERNEKGELSLRSKRKEDAKVGYGVLNEQSVFSEHRTLKTEHSAVTTAATFFPEHLDSNRDYEVGYRFALEADNPEIKWRMVEKKTGEVVDSVKVAEFFGLDEDVVIDSEWISFPYQSVEKEENEISYILEGEFPESSLFLQTPKDFILEFGLRNTKETKKVEIFHTPSTDSKVDKIKTLSKLKNPKILLFSKLPMNIKMDNGKCFYSLETKMESLSKTPDTDSLVNLIYNNGFDYLIVDELVNPYLKWHINRMIEEKSILSLVEQREGLSLYKINKIDSVSFVDFDKIIYKWTPKSDDKLIGYYNKKTTKQTGIFVPLSDGILLGGLEEKSYFLFAFANDKVWKKDSGYIDVSEGFLRFRLKGESLTESTILYPLISLYDKNGDLITTYDGEKLEITKLGYYDFEFGIRYYKETSPYLEMPNNCEKIAISLYFYKEKGIVEIGALSVYKGDLKAEE